MTKAWRATGGRRLAAVLLGSTALITPCAAQVTEPRPAPAAQTAQALTFAIPPQALDAALAAFGAASGVQVLYDAAMTQRLRSPGVAGTLPAEEALRRLLAGTGLVARFTGPRMVTLVPAPAATGAVTLDPVQVQGTIRAETAWGPVDGIVARRSAAATKTDTPILETPQAVSVVTRQQMDTRGVQRVGDILRYTAGVFVEPYGAEPRYDSMQIRGFDQSTGRYRDGLRDIAGVWTHFRAEPYGLERMDVMKGPSSVLYGQNQPGGVTNAITKAPPERPLHEVEVQAGSYDRYQGAFDFGGPLDAKGSVLYRVTALARDSGTQFRYANGDRVPDDRIYVAPAVTWRPGDDTSLTVRASHLYNKTQSAFTYTRPGGEPTHVLIGEPDFNRYQYDQNDIGYQLEHHLNDAVTLRQNLRYGEMDFSYRNMGASLQADGRTLSRTASSLDETLRGVTVDNQVQSRFATGPLEHTVLVGLDYQWQTYTQRSWSGTGPTLDLLNPVYGQPVTTPTRGADTRQTKSQIGLYAQDQIRFDQDWIVTLGVRQDWAESNTRNRANPALSAKTEDDAFTWRAGVTRLIGPEFAIYGSYSESFMPSAGTDFFGNAFVPTTGRQYEAGVKYQPTGFNGLFTAAVFDLVQQNVLTPDTDRPGTGFRVQTGEIRSRGVELEATVGLARGLNLVASFTWNDLEVTKSNGADLGKKPAWQAEKMASLWADYSLLDGGLAGLGFGAGVRYVGPTWADAANTLRNDGFTVADAEIHYDLEGWRLGLNASNLFDKQYVKCTGTTSCTWGTGRTIIGSLKYRW